MNHLSSFLPVVKKDRHKYETGEVIGWAGSPTMPGAALLACLGAMRGGAGIVRLLHPPGMENLLAHSPYEVIKLPLKESPQEVALRMNKAKGLFIGPGLGREEETVAFFQELFPLLTSPCVVDGDALHFLSLDLLKRRSCDLILTPHKGELCHLPGLNEGSMEECRRFVETHKVTLVRKGMPTFIFHPGLPTYVNEIGDPCMATAGSGDVLTGLLAALLAQGVAPFHAACLGVYLHGFAGVYVAKKRGSPYGVIASDIAKALQEGFRELNKGLVVNHLF